MGLDACVRCRCWEEGQVTSPPPFAEHVKLDEEGFLHLDLPWSEHRDAHRAFDEWRESCCAHRDMEFASERIANWAGLRLFQGQLREFGIDQFPALRDVLPNGNGGMVPAAKSADALKELDDFASRDLGSKVVLVDADTGEELQEFVPAYHGVFTWAPRGWEGGVDPSGFFIRGPSGWREAVLKAVSRKGGPKQRITSTLPGNISVIQPSKDVLSRLRARVTSALGDAGKREWFRSRACRQEQIGPHAFRLTDDATGTEFVSPIGVSKAIPWPDGRMQDDQGRSHFGYPARLGVESRRCAADEFEYILRPLRIVFRASVETGNPVQWL
jgi:hypothetical protein